MPHHASPPTLFIADLHLSAQRPQISQLFINFLHGAARQAEALYILGDLFEYWIGDDAPPAEHEHVLKKLRETAESGTAIYIMHGNRDFLLGDAFASATATQIIQDPTLIDLYGTPTLLMHGDTLCSDDTDYQKVRSTVRNPQWQQQFLSHTPAQRAALAAGYRDDSRKKTQSTENEIMDANPQAVVEAMQRHNATRLIHGHTHRPAIHDLQLKNGTAQRIVLGDWYKKGSVLICDAQGARLDDVE
ncbi:MAG: UDP-2,3-diacylglucosamine diphosphatase [Gammaproteobacteria bacterium]|nr:UDP-2,3-diacylglucosamine diphosphatase [Gammaproteobacteria bacterium]